MAKRMVRSVRGGADRRRGRGQRRRRAGGCGDGAHLRSRAAAREARRPRLVPPHLPRNFMRSRFCMWIRFQRFFSAISSDLSCLRAM